MGLGLLLLLVILAWALVYGVVSGLSGEYGRGVVEWTAIVPVALLVGLVVAGLVRRMLDGANTGRTVIAAAAVASLGVAVAAAVGALTGGAAHQQRQDAIATSCEGGADTRTIAFAGEAGRIIPTNGRSATGRSDGCSVTIAIDKAKGNDALAVIEQAVAGGEWQRRGDAVWVADDGFQIEVRVDTSFTDDAEHAVDVVGTRP